MTKHSMRPQRLAIAVIAALLMAATGTATASSDYTDDTEVFFDQTPTASTSPNVLFLLDTGAKMGETLTGAATNPATGLTKTRMQVVKDALMKVLTDYSTQSIPINVGLMRLSVNGSGGSAAAKGGMIVKAVEPLGSDLTAMKNTLCLPTAAKPVNQDVLNDASSCDQAYPNGNKNAGGGKPVFATQDLLGDGSGAAPLTEMMFEAYRYYSGKSVLWGGTGSNIGPSYKYPSVDASLTSAGGSTYKSPIAQGCQSNFIVILSDGIMAEDTGSDKSGDETKAIEKQPFISTYAGPGTGPVAGGGYTKCSRNYLPNTTTEITFSGKKFSPCGDDLAYYMDQYGVTLPTNTKVPVTTYVIGFDVSNTSGSDANNATALLQMIARAGGGKFFTANDQAVLEDVFRGILDEIVIQNASFSSPTVAVNAFNRTQNLDSLYMSVFAPKTTTRWPGNIKKYKLDPNGDIVDDSSPPASAVGANGFFRAGSRSFWSSTADGNDASKGGAASQIPVKASRNIYTNTSTGTSQLVTDSSLTSHALSSLKSLTATTKNTLFGITCTSQTSPIASASCPSADQLIDWAYGDDVSDVIPKNGNGNVTEARKDMGDSLHGRPAVVIYGGTTGSPNVNDARVFTVTNDGFLHAFNASTGAETWAFVPYGQLGRLQNIYQNLPMNPRQPLGLDGTIRVLKLDRCRDGIVDTSTFDKNTNPCGGDRVYLYFGMRRGGSHYYALDVTTKDTPKLMWIAGPSSDTSISSSNRLPLIGQTWSTPAVGKAAVPGTSQDRNGADDAIDDFYVLMFGGGYDNVVEDGVAAKAYQTDTVGTGIYMVDAVTGNLLWRAGPNPGSPVPTPDLTLSSLTNAVPADVRALDITGDGMVDVVYTADLGGRIWRFDVDNSASTMSNFIRGGVFASLGATGSATNARRFFIAPDISYVKSGTTSWFNIAIGSGNRELPITDTVTDDKFYSLRDYKSSWPYNWSTYTPITDALLTDVTPIATTAADGSTTYTQTAVGTNAPGWKLSLNYFSGEKVITESRTFENTVFFSSFYPKTRTGGDDTDADACTTTKGYNNLYTVSVFDAKACATCIAALVNKGKDAIASGIGVILKQPGIAPEPVFLFPTPDGNADSRVPPVCLVGAESCGTYSSYEPKRTYWLQKGAE